LKRIHRKERKRKRKEEQGKIKEEIKEKRKMKKKRYERKHNVICIYKVRHQNPDKFQFKFSAILCLCQRLLLARKPDASRL